jgi:6-phosphogluconolactonase
MDPKIKIFNNNREIADYLVHLLASAITHDRTFQMCLSGGNTPKSIFSLISGMKAPAIPWDNVGFFWGDERCVPPDHVDSNYLMAANSLLNKLNIREECIFRIMGENDPDIEKKRYGQIVQTNTRGVFDLAFLGLGMDGHTASIFPDQMYILESNDTCEKAVHPESGQIRITLTGKIINASRRIVFLVTGSEKSEIVHSILNRTGDWADYPASYIHPANGQVLWLLDKEAGSKM